MTSRTMGLGGRDWKAEKKTRQLLEKKAKERERKRKWEADKAQQASAQATAYDDLNKFLGDEDEDDGGADDPSDLTYDRCVIKGQLKSVS